MAKSRSSKTEEMLHKRNKHVPLSLHNTTKVVVKKASGHWLEDVDGKKFLDFSSGISVVNAGHSHPYIIKAVNEQLDKGFHTCFHVTMTTPYIQLAERISELLPGDFDKKVMFLNSGAEATENAIKFARLYTGRKAIIAAEHGFHGRTYGALSLTSKTVPLKEGMDPFLPEVYRIPFPYCYRCGKRPAEQCCLDSPEFLESQFSTHVAAKNVAAIIVEPIVGEGGIIIPRKEYLENLRKVCDSYGILLIFDEIQTGFGRTGKMFAQEHFEVYPDITLLAKAIANGLPLAAVAGRVDIMDKPNPGAVGSTFGGNPVSCAAGNAMLDVLHKENLVGRSKSLGDYLLQELKKFESKYRFIGEVRGLGLMAGIELVEDKKRKAPNKKLAQLIISRCVEEGLIVVGGGVYSNIIRVLPPLTISENDLKTGMKILESICNEMV